MVDPDGVHAVEQFVLAKYYLTANVYRHRVRLITDQMIGRAIMLGIEVDELEELRKLYQFDNSAEFIQRYQGWDDGRFMEVFCPSTNNPPGKWCGEVLRRLRERNLLKQVFTQKIEVFDARSREMLKELPHKNRDGLRRRIEQGLAEKLAKELDAAVDDQLVIAHSFNIKSVANRPGTTRKESWSRRGQHHCRLSRRQPCSNQLTKRMETGSSRCTPR